MTRPRVLFVSHDPVGSKMAGLGIRYLELARALAPDCDVSVAHGGRQREDHDGIPLVPFAPHAPASLRSHLAAADVVVSQPVWPTLSAMLRRSGARIVHDLYDPETLETIELFRDARPALRRLHTALTLDRLDDALRTGHHFVCASEKQRDLWLGAMLAKRMVSPAAYDADPSFRSTIDVVPFGLPEPPTPAQLAGPGPREAFPAIAEGDEVVLWNGGIWRWLDAGTAIRAIATLASRRPTVKLVFMGGSTQPAARAATEEARTMAHELGLLDRHVFFNEGWVPYDKRGAWLAQAACVISTAPEHLETRFAFRTRLLDAFWVGLPVVCTSGDALADLIEREGLGATARPSDHESVAAAVEAVLGADREHVDHTAGARRAHQWARVVQPLRDWSSTPASPVRPRLSRSAGSRLRSAAYASGARHAFARAAKVSS